MNQRFELNRECKASWEALKSAGHLTLLHRWHKLCSGKQTTSSSRLNKDKSNREGDESEHEVYEIDGKSNINGDQPLFRIAYQYVICRRPSSVHIRECQLANPRASPVESEKNRLSDGRTFYSTSTTHRLPFQPILAAGAGVQTRCPPNAPYTAPMAEKPADKSLPATSRSGHRISTLP